MNAQNIQPVHLCVQRNVIASVYHLCTVYYAANSLYVRLRISNSFGFPLRTHRIDSFPLSQLNAS